MNFFDIVLDFILMDAFEDLESPPSSVVAVLRNRWLSDSFKETVHLITHMHTNKALFKILILTQTLLSLHRSALVLGSGDSLLVSLKGKETPAYGEFENFLSPRVVPFFKCMSLILIILFTSTGPRWFYLTLLCYIRTCEPSFSFWVFGTQAALK